MTSNRETSLSRLLTNYFPKLNDQKSSYCILRNYEELPYYTSNDVDFWVDDIKSASRLLLSSADSLELKIFLFRDWAGLQNYWFIHPETLTEPLHIDLIERIQWRGCSLVDESELLKARTQFKSFFVPALEIQGACNFLSGLLSREEVREKYRQQSVDYVRSYPDEFLRIVTYPFGRSHALKLLAFVLNEDWTAIERLVPSLKRSITVRSLVRSPFFQFKRWLAYLVRTFQRLYSLPGFQVAIVGIDGAGKTTLSRALSGELKRIFPALVHTWWFAGALPLLSKIVKSARLSNTQDGLSKHLSHSKSYQRHEVGRIKGLVRLFYYFLDYFIFYWTRGLSCRFFGGVVINERYFYDFLIDLLMSRHPPPRWLVILLIKYMPRPDLIVFLDVPAPIAFNRKQEEAAPVLQLQIDSWKAILPLLQNVFHVSSLDSIDTNVQKVMRSIFSAGIRKHDFPH